MGSINPKEIKYNLRYGEVRGHVLRPPQGGRIAITNIGLQTKENGNRGAALERVAGTITGSFITKTILFKYTENFTTKKKNQIKILIEAVLTSTHNVCFEQKYEK